MKINVLLLFLISILFTSELLSQVEIKTFSGYKFSGFIDSVSDANLLTLKTLDDSKISFRKKDVVSIRQISMDMSLKNGSHINCKYESEDDSTYFVRSVNNASMAIRKNDIKEINFILVNLKNKYGMLGISALTPGGINLVCGYHSNGGIGLRLAIGMLPWNTDMYGIQINVLFNLKKSENFEHNLSFSLGFSHIPEEQKILYSIKTVMKEWTYLGFHYDLNYHGWFLEPGLTIGSGDFSNPRLSFQIGYVYRFIK